MFLPSKICFQMLNIRERTKLTVVYMNFSFKEGSLNYLLKTFVLWILLQQTLYPKIEYISHKKTEFKYIVGNSYVLSYCIYIAFRGVTSDKLYLVIHLIWKDFFSSESYIVFLLQNLQSYWQTGAENGCNACIFLVLC